MIINKLCGGVEMVCICVHTPDDDPFKDTHCVLGLDDNGKVGACGWNHLQRVDQFLISSVCYEKNWDLLSHKKETVYKKRLRIECSVV